MGTLVVLAPLAWLVAWQSGDSGWLLGADAVMHLVAFVVAIGYGVWNRRWGWLALSVASPFAFIGLVLVGPSESCDFLGVCPTSGSLFFAYTVANLALAAGLLNAAFLRGAPLPVASHAVGDLASAGDHTPIDDDEGVDRWAQSMPAVVLVAAGLIVVVVSPAVLVAVFSGWGPGGRGGENVDVQPTPTLPHPPVEMTELAEDLSSPRTSEMSSAPSTATTEALSASTSTVFPPTSTSPVSDDLDAGLLCRELAAKGYSYPEAVTYWAREGRPDRVDADRNGIPCETVYPAADVAAFWGDPLATTTTEAPGVHYSIATHADSGLWPDALPVSVGWWGSGCSPGSGTLPNGIWWGYVTELTPTSVTFDLACIQFVSESDDDPATEDHAWLIENASARPRVVPVSPDASVACMWRDCPPNPFPYGDWIEDDSVPHGDGGREGGIWLYVNGGTVTEIADAIVAG